MLIMTSKQDNKIELIGLPAYVSDEGREITKRWSDMQTTAKGLSMKKILIIEDQSDIRKLVKMTLDFSEYELHEASDAHAGFAMVKAIQPDLILLDIMMPGEMDGLNLCAMLKSSDTYQHIPILLLTARGQVADRYAGLEAGADEYLVKPFSPIKLIEVVESLLLKDKRQSQ
jgi:two-component system, OmpR family, phosphate regulon response regulator PhoB